MLEKYWLFLFGMITLAAVKKSSYAPQPTRQQMVFDHMKSDPK